MRVSVVAVGKLKDKSLRAVADDYLGRLKRYVPCDEIEVRDDGALARALPVDALLIALQVGGTALTSEGFAKQLERWLATGKGHVAFVIGGAEGIPAGVAKRAQLELSLSSMTLPHRLARVVLFEQLYRAMTILRHEPYAREG